jgi:hypothetical protein
MAKSPVVKKKKSFALDIFKILGDLNEGNLNVWQQLTPEEQKSFSPYVIARWMSGTNDAKQLFLVNELVNIPLFSLAKEHMELLAKLLACCGTKKKGKRFFWVAAPKKDNSSGLEVVKEYFGYSSREAREQYHLLSQDDIIEMAEELGYQQDELKKLKKDLTK